jgi:hypothetical protein
LGASIGVQNYGGDLTNCRPWFDFHNTLPAAATEPFGPAAMLLNAGA